MLLENRTSVITGCNRGIGKAILEDFARHGSDVFAVVRKEDLEFCRYCEHLSKDYHVIIEPVYADFQSDEDIKQAARSIVKTKKKIDVLVNNIGIANPLSMLTMTKMETIREAFQINLFSALLFTQLVGKSMMRNQQGSVIFLSSSAAFDGGSNIEYSASKAAVVGAVRRLALEFGKFNIRINAVAPGLTDTDMGNSMSPEDEAIAASRNVMGRKAKPEEIADVVLFMASDLSRFMTGQVLRVDGGLLK